MPVAQAVDAPRADRLALGCTGGLVPGSPQVGTLDALMQLSDDLNKADMMSEATVTKLVSALASLLDRNMEKLESNLTANGSMGKRVWRGDAGAAT